MTDGVLDSGVIETLRGLPSPDGRSMVACVAELYARDSVALIRQIRDAEVAGDWASLASAAHALKSYAGNVGALGLARQLRELEFAAKAGDGATCATLLQALESACAAVEAALAVEAHRP